MKKLLVSFALACAAIGGSVANAQGAYPSRPVKVIVPQPKKDLPLPTLRSIERQGSVSLRRLR